MHSEKKKKFPTYLPYFFFQAVTWGVGGGAFRLFYGKRVLFWNPVRLDWNWAIFVNVHQSPIYRNNAIFSFVFIICQSEQFDFYTFNTNDHRQPYLNSIYMYKWKYLDSM